MTLHIEQRPPSEKAVPLRKDMKYGEITRFAVAAGAGAIVSTYLGSNPNAPGAEQGNNNVQPNVAPAQVECPPSQHPSRQNSGADEVRAESNDSLAGEVPRVIMIEPSVGTTLEPESDNATCPADGSDIFSVQPGSCKSNEAK